MDKPINSGDPKKELDRAKLEKAQKLTLPVLEVRPKRTGPSKLDLRSPDEKKGWIDDPEDLRALRKIEGRKKVAHSDPKNNV